ncbi:MAG: hypothetical protein IJX39_06070 [Clostridia bacterium]|nr:hypothetical protein [Clostridia bacterium]
MKRRILCLILCVITLVPLLAIAPSAATDVDVADELENYTIDGKAFDQSDYPLDPMDTDVYILTIREEGVDPAVSYVQWSYKFYIYFYNPSGRNLTMSDDSVVFMTFSEENDDTYVSTAEPCYVVDIQYSSDNRFLRVQYDVPKLFVSQNYDRRIYHIYEFRFWEYHAKYNACFFVTGFETTDNLAYSEGSFLTLDLELNGTVWRDENFVSLDDPYHYQELATVYFTIPQDVYEVYDRIYQVTTEFFLFNSTPIVVTNSEELNNMDIAYLKSGYTVDNYIEGVPTLSYGDLYYVKYFAGEPNVFIAPEWVYNPADKAYLESIYDFFSVYGYDYFTEIYPSLCYFFYNPDIVVDEKNNSFYQAVPSGQLTSYVDQFSQYYYPDTYTSFVCGIAPELYESMEKYNVVLNPEDIYDYELGTTIDKPYEDRSWWARIWNLDKWQEVTEKVKQVFVITDPAAVAAQYANDPVGLSEAYKIGVADAPGFIEYLRNADGVVTLCRFANTQYECRELDCNPKLTDGDVWLCRASFYQDVDVTFVTFEKDGKEYVYAVNADPIDMDGGVGVKNDANLKPSFNSNEFKNAVYALLSGARDAGSKLKSTLIIVAIVLLLVFIVWLIVKLFGPGQKVTIKYDPPDGKRKRKK